jgi:hypothetical protein
MKPDKHTQNLLQKFVNDQCTKEELEQVIAYFKNAADASSIPSVEEILSMLNTKSTMDDHTANRIYGEIIKLGKAQRKRRIPNWRYTAAAILVIALASAYFLRDTIFNNTIETTTPIIVNNQIEPGTDKATLTLETGEQVALQKGTTYQTQNASSNGEEIVYKDGRRENRDKLVYNTLTIPRGGQFFIKLSDGTQVWLNSETQLKYPVSFVDGESRQVELVYGEAYFEVSHSTKHKGSDFKVMHDQQDVQVLGTKFNIKAYKDETHIYTTLVEGSVAVNTGSINRVLKPGEQSKLEISGDGLSITTVDVNAEIAWIHGDFVFQYKSLGEIMNVLSRWYDMDVTFEHDTLANMEFNGQLSKFQSIEDILQMIKTTNTIENFEINRKSIILK